MINVDYKITKNTKGIEKAVRIDLKTGKQEVIDVRVAKKRISDLKYRRNRNKVEYKLKDAGYGGTFKEYKAQTELIEKEITYKRKKEGQRPLTGGEMRGRTKKIAIEYRTGEATRFRFAWFYTQVVERYYDKELQKTVVECETPSDGTFVADSLTRGGDEFDNMVELCQEEYDDIIQLDLCHLDGGACVLYYNRSDKSIIKQFELGKGCGFSFDFTERD